MQNYSNKPKMIMRLPNEIVIDWGNTFSNENASNFQLQIQNELKDWLTIYCGSKTQIKAGNLAPCTCYNFRIKLANKDAWVYFKAATEDEGPYSSVMHMSRAVKMGKMPLVRKIASCRPHLLEAENKDNKTPVVQAIESGDIQVLQLLISLGANINTPLFYTRRTPLMIAVYRGQLQIAAVLVDKGARVNAQDVNGLTILHYAVDSKNIESTKFCLEIIENINCVDNMGCTALTRAAILKASEEMVDLLLQNGLDKSIKDKLGFDFDKYRKFSIYNVS